jgi:pilus assembly protein Flp/PilA
MQNFLSRFMRDESGATAIEYCLIAGGVGVVIVVAVQALGTAVTASFQGSANAVNAANAPAG